MNCKWSIVNDAEISHSLGDAKLASINGICKFCSVRVWDVAILVPNLIFLLFLIYKFGRVRQKLRQTRSPVFKAFFLLVS